MNRIKNHIHRANRRIGINALNQLFVVGYTMGSPHKWHDIVIIRIPITGELIHHISTHMAHVRQLGLIQRLQNAGWNQSGNRAS